MPGLAGFGVTGWAGIFAPRAAPAAVQAKLASDLSEALKSPVTKERYQGRPVSRRRN